MVGSAVVRRHRVFTNTITTFICTIRAHVAPYSNIHHCTDLKVKPLNDQTGNTIHNICKLNVDDADKEDKKKDKEAEFKLPRLWFSCRYETWRIPEVS